MASFLNQENEEDKGAIPGAKPVGQSLAQPGTNSAAQPGAVARTGQPKATSSMPDLEKIQTLNANKIYNTGNQIATGLQGTLNSAQQTLGKEVQGYQQKADSLKYGNNEFAGRGVTDVANNSGDRFAQVANKGQDFTRGLGQFKSELGAGQVAGANTDIQKTATYGGQSEALSNLAKGRGVRSYSQGERSFDAALMGGNSGLQNNFNALRQQSAQQAKESVDRANAQAGDALRNLGEYNKAQSTSANQWYQQAQLGLQQSVAQATAADQIRKQEQIKAALAGQNLDPNDTSLQYRAGLNEQADAPLIDAINRLNQLGNRMGYATTANAPLSSQVNDQAIRDALRNLGKDKVYDTSGPRADPSKGLPGIASYVTERDGVQSVYAPGYVPPEPNTSNSVAIGKPYTGQLTPEELEAASQYKEGQATDQSPNAIKVK